MTVRELIKNLTDMQKSVDLLQSQASAYEETQHIAAYYSGKKDTLALVLIYLKLME